MWQEGEAGRGLVGLGGWGGEGGEGLTGPNHSQIDNSGEEMEKKLKFSEFSRNKYI